jgi:hypothetical protein
VAKGSKARTAKHRESLKKEFLALLAKGYGILAASKKIGASRGSYYNWKKLDPEFAAAADRIVSDPVHQKRILSKSGKANMSVDMNWQGKFIAMYRQTGDKVEAAQTAGKTTVEVSDALNTKSESYDEEFHLAFLEEEQRRLWVIEDNTLRKAEHDAPTARFVLSNLLKEKYGKVSEGSVTVNQNWNTQRGDDEAEEFLDGLFGNKGAMDHESERSLDSGYTPSSNLNN